MKNLIVFIYLILFQSALCFSQDKNISKNSLLGVFDGRTPCQELAKQINEKTIPECIKIKWRLTLYHDSISHQPTEYKLEGFVYKGKNIRTGKWQILKGTPATPEAIVYRLDQEGKESLFLQKCDDNVLFFLDPEKNLMVGNRDFSYALNRTDRMRVN